MTKLIAIFAVVALFAGHASAAPRSRVLLLDNQQILEGEIEQVGDQYRVRREGGETLVPAPRVVTVCDTVEAVYEFLRGKVDPTNAAAHFRLARWCDANGLRVQAAAEAKLAAELAPSQAIVLATYKQLQRKADAPPPPPAPAVLPPSVLNAPVEPIDCGAEAYKRFAMKVQPVLMNTCASCHAGTYTGKFRLERVYDDSSIARAATQRNLAVALAQVDRAKPAASPLLLQATSPHGGAALPPLRDRGVPAFKQLDEWTRLSVSDSSAPPATPEPPVVTTAATDPKSEFGAGVPKKSEPMGPKDPFDAAIFNQQNHPDAPKP
jgi:hypothetical protein